MGDLKKGKAHGYKIKVWKKTKINILSVNDENVENNHSAINNEEDICNMSEDNSNSPINPDCL